MFHEQEENICSFSGDQILALLLPFLFPPLSVSGCWSLATQSCWDTGRAASLGVGAKGISSSRRELGLVLFRLWERLVKMQPPPFMLITDSSLMKAFKFKASAIKAHRSTVACLHAK